MHSRAKKQKLSVCLSWCGETGLQTFVHDMGDPPDGKGLMRRDPEAGYSKANCVWATKYEQLVILDGFKDVWYMGQYRTYKEIGEMYGVKGNTIQTRVRRGWTLDEAICGRQPHISVA